MTIPCRAAAGGIRGRRACALLALAVTAALLCSANPALSAAQSGLVVVPRSSSQDGLSYFKLQVGPGLAARAGEIELRNMGPTRLRAALAPVNGETLSTLGSGYSSLHSQTQRSTRWLRIGSSLAVLAPGASTTVPVSVLAPADARPGDYLSGVSVEALDQGTAAGRPRAGISIASVDRYVIGVEVQIDGPRHPLIRFTGAAVQRQPASLTFLLLASNPGNVILQNTRGRAWITQGQRTVASVALGPGTFVTGTSIAYPIPTPGEHPRQGAVYRVRAYLRYAGGTAWLDTPVRFGRAAALAQQAYGGPRASPSVRGPASGLSAWLAALLGAAGCLGALFFVLLLLLRRRRAGAGSPLRVLEGALRASRRSGEPLSVITVAILDGPVAAHRLAPVVRARLRRSDRMCRLDGWRLLVVAPDTAPDTAQALADDLRRHLAHALDGQGALAVSVHVPDGEGAVELLRRVRESDGGARVPTPA
jgi:hypothetical protein